MKKLLTALGGAAVLLLWLAAPASAHVATSITEAPAGGFVAVSFRIGHGCEGAGGDTEKVEIQMPEGIDAATPEFIPGWEATVDDAGPVVVTWEGGPLPTDQYLEFGVSVQMPDTPGETALFPTIQTCESGEEIAWIEETPESGEEPEHPAPVVAITEAEADGHGGEAEGEGGGEGASDEDKHESDDAAADSAESEESEDSDNLAVVALVVAAVALLAAGYAVMSSRRSPATPADADAAVDTADDPADADAGSDTGADSDDGA